jgi:hypothetical protein
MIKDGPNAPSDETDSAAFCYPRYSEDLLGDLDYSLELSGFKIIELCGGQIEWQYAAAEFSSSSFLR